MSQRGHAGARPAIRSRVAVSNDDTTAWRSSGAPAGGQDLDHGSVVLALQLDVEEGAPPDREQDVREGRDAEASSASAVRASARSGRPWTRVERLVVEHDRHAVGRAADVDLDAVAGRDGERRLDRREAVLRGVPPVAAMGEPQRVALDDHGAA